MSTRRIAHIDMDAFFASVELLRYPQLKHLPVVVGGRAPNGVLPYQQHPTIPAENIPISAFPRIKHYAGRGVATTANYIARQFGVGSAMGIMKCAEKCPEAILLPADFEQYRHYSKLFKQEIMQVSPYIEDRGIDEVFVDLSHLPNIAHDGGLSIAQHIQHAIFEKTQLTCSIGLAPNKLLAKIASELNKPNGIAEIFERDIKKIIWPMPCRKINGIGPKTDQRLQQLNIFTIADIAKQNPLLLQEHFGQRYGAWLARAAQGEDNSPVKNREAPSSISRETTFSRDLHARHDKAELSDIFTRLCIKLADDLKRKSYAARTIGIKIKYDNFKIVSRDISIEKAINDPQHIRHIAGLCLKRVDLNQRFRLLGVRLSHLEKIDGDNFESKLIIPSERKQPSLQKNLTLF